MENDINLSYPHKYTAEVLSEIPSGNKDSHYYYPGGSLEGGHDGLLLKIFPEKKDPWVATFAKGRGGLSGVFSMPNPEKICVVSSGVGYIVSASEPLSWEKVEAFKIVDVRLIPRHNLVAFVDADRTEIVSYNAHGIAWHTKQIGLDGLRITQVTENEILGKYWDIRSDSDMEFSVNLETGKSTSEDE